MEKLSFHYYSTTPVKTKSRKPTTQRAPTKQCLPPLIDVLYQNECPSNRSDGYSKSGTGTGAGQALRSPESNQEKPDDVSHWYWSLKQSHYGSPPSPTDFRTSRFRWNEEEQTTLNKAPTKHYINPFKSKKKGVGKLGGPEKRKIIEKWGKMWDSALSDMQFDRIVFENNPDGEERQYRSDAERINDGCEKLCGIAKLNQNIITTMMKKFVSGPPNKLYTLNRIEAAQCWKRIINDDGLVNENCCVDIPLKHRRKFGIASLRKPAALEKDTFRKISIFRIPVAEEAEVNICTEIRENEEGTGEKGKFKRNPAYWLDPNLVPPVPPGFKEHEFQMSANTDPTGLLQRELQQNREIAKRYTRFQSTIERSKYVVPNLEKVNQIMDEHFVSRDPKVRRETMLHNFYSSPKIETSPNFLKDALFATILANDENPKAKVTKKPFPYSLAEMTKSKADTMFGRRS